MIRDNISGILNKIAAVCQRIGRDPGEIVLVGVTKFADISEINEAIESGLKHIGENKVQEAQRKFPSVGNVTRHMIGHLQTNKAKSALECFDLIQSVDSLKLAAALDVQAAKQSRNVDILLQVNTAEEDQKFGCAPGDAIALVEEIVKLKGVRVTGLMTIAPQTQEAEVVRKCFADLRFLSEKIRSQCSGDNLNMKYLSMGMTDDYEIALEEGANMVRIGRAIFQ